MNRNELKCYILENYHASADCPWVRYPDCEVLRHRDSKKWFAVIMDVPKERFGLPGDDTLMVVNLKCDPILIGSLLKENGFFPAYHMNKEFWISVALDGTIQEERIKMLVDISYRSTAKIYKKY